MDFKAGLYDASGAGITGSTDLKIKIKRDADDYFYDFNDTTFRGSGWTSVSGTMTEVNVAVVPGEYELSVDSAEWGDGVYTVYFEYIGTVITPFRDSVEFRTLAGYPLDDTILRWIRNGLIFEADKMKLLDDDDVTVLLQWVLSKGNLGVLGPYNRARAT